MSKSEQLTKAIDATMFGLLYHPKIRDVFSEDTSRDVSIMLTTLANTAFKLGGNKPTSEQVAIHTATPLDLEELAKRMEALIIGGAVSDEIAIGNDAIRDCVELVRQYAKEVQGE